MTFTFVFEDDTIHEITVDLLCLKVGKSLWKDINCFELKKYFLVPYLESKKYSIIITRVNSQFDIYSDDSKVSISSHIYVFVDVIFKDIPGSMKKYFNSWTKEKLKAYSNLKEFVDPSDTQECLKFQESL
jgi:hypothetical protein